MRIFAAVIKILIFILAMIVAVMAIWFGIKTVAYFSITAMFLLFLCQAAEIFLGYKK